MIGAGAVVVKIVVPYAIVTGNPARQSGWISEAGIPLDFDATGLVRSPSPAGLQIRKWNCYPAQ